MKKQLLFSIIFSGVILASSCSHKKVEKEDEVNKLTEKELDSLITGFDFTVSKAYRLVGKDSIDLLADPIIKGYNEAVFLAFSEGEVYFFGGKPTSKDYFPANTMQFPASAKTFSLNTRIRLPTNMSYHWDTDKGTMVVESKGTSSYLPIIPSGKKAYLDKSKVHIVMIYEQAKNGSPSSITFNFEDFVIEMKPLWIYYVAPLQQVSKDMVVF